MTELQAQVAKLIDARNSLEQQLIKVHQAIEDSITANERGARVESHISKCPVSYTHLTLPTTPYV